MSAVLRMRKPLCSPALLLLDKHPRDEMSASLSPSHQVQGCPLGYLLRAPCVPGTTPGMGAAHIPLSEKYVYQQENRWCFIPLDVYSVADLQLSVSI